MSNKSFNNFSESCCGREKRRARALNRFAIGLLSHLKRAACETSVFDFKVAQIWKSGCETKRVAVARVNTRHERLNEILIRLAPDPPADKCTNGFIAIDRFGRLDEVKTHTRFAKP